MGWADTSSRDPAFDGRFVALICTVDALRDVEYTNEGEHDGRGGICINVTTMEQGREDGRTWGERRRR